MPVPQLGDQLVEFMQRLDTSAPVSFSSLQQQFVEQIIDIPVPGTRGDRGGLQGFEPRKNSQRTVEQIVDILTGGGLQGFLLDQGFFRTFLRLEKGRSPPGVRVRGCTGTQAHPR